MALAAAVKRGGRIWLGHSGLARSIREYPAVGDIWRMIARTAYVQLHFSPLLLIGTVLGMALTFLVPPFAALFGQGWHAGAAGSRGAPWRRATSRHCTAIGRSVLWAPSLPAVAAFYLAATLGSALNHYVGRGVAWKGRAYA